MATTTKQMFNGAATATTTTQLYAVPSATTAVVTNIVVSNTSGSAQTFTIGLGGTSLATTVSIGANSIATFDMKQVLTASQTITGGASATSVNFFISGVEIA